MKNILILVFVAFSSLLIAQTVPESYSRIEVSLESVSLKRLVELGMCVDHGEIRKQVFVSDFSEREQNILKQYDIKFEVVIKDVAKHYEVQNDFIQKPVAGDNCEVVDGFKYTIPENYKYGSMGGYITYDDLMLTLDSMRILYPNLISAKAPIGEFQTYEGRSIHWVRISKDADTEHMERPQVLYDALHHAREANSLSQLVFYMWYLLENYDTDEEIKYLVDNTEMYFVPCVNPDGYVYNEETNPNGGGMWRKNRFPNANGTYGVDLNRNYGDHWDYPGGASTDPESDTYKGTAPFSEPETQAMKALCEAHEFKIALNYHTYSNLLIHPYGFEDSLTVDDPIFKSLGKLYTQENDYLVGTGLQTVGYNVTGDSDDWMYGEQVTKPKIFSMTPEVGPASYGFWPPESAIMGLNQENLFQNLAVAHSVHANVVFDNSVNYTLNPGNNQFKLNFENVGFQDGTVDVTIESLSAKLTFETTTIPDLAVASFGIYDKIISYELSAVSNKENIAWVVHVSHDNYTIRDTFETIIYGDFDAIANGDEMTDWNSSDWKETTNDFFTAPTSITDSPSGKYSNNIDSYIDFGQALDLSDYEAAFISYNAKWDIEKAYDYVQIMASTNNVDFQALCGKYTIIGNGNQDIGQPLYDGLQADWVQEKIDLTDFLGESTVYLRFRLISDQYETEDGFYFDDFIVQGISKMDVADRDLFYGSEINIYPNPVQDHLTIEVDNHEVSNSITVNNVLGEVIFKADFIGKYTINTAQWVEGIYSIEMKDENGRTMGYKVVK